MAIDTMEMIGGLLGGEAGRDAIHIAVEPVIAGERLMPGENILLRDGAAWSGAFGTTIGIVDPFLKEAVKIGSRFFMFLYPRTITSLRHVWTHPAFEDAEPPKPPEAAQGSGRDAKASEEWLRNFAFNSDCPNYETLIAAASGVSIEDEDGYGSAYVDGECLHFNGLDAHGEIPPEFWDHVEKVTGKTIHESKRASWFSCSC